MDFQIIGPVEIRNDAGEQVPLIRRKSRALLALLLVNANRSVPREEIDDKVWPNGPPNRDSYRKYVQKLRRTLRDHCGCAVDMPQLRNANRMNVDPQLVDYHRFQGSLLAARQAETSELMLDRARSALGEWHGIALQDLDDDSTWVCSIRHSLDQQRAEAWQLMLRSQLDLGKPLDVLAEIGQPLVDWPWDETLIGLRMLALHQVGRATEASETYNHYRRRHADEHGQPPGDALQTLFISILNNDPTLAPPRAEAVTTARIDKARGYLPARPPLIGRKKQLTELSLMLHAGQEAPSSTAVSGMAGVGKTAIAVCAAHDAERAGYYPGGVLFLELHGYRDDMRVTGERAVSLALRQLGVPEDEIPTSEPELVALYRSILDSWARDRRWVLVLADDASSSEQVRRLIPPGGGHRLMVVGRDTLADLHDDVRLVEIDLVSRKTGLKMLAALLHSARPDDNRLTENRRAAREIVRLCGRLPLAIRVIGAILASDPEVSLKETAEELRILAQRLPAMHYGKDLQVHTAFTLSYRRLDSAQARLFRLLALDPSARTSTAAAAALVRRSTPETHRLLLELRRAHLVERSQHHGWWSFHDLLRLYAHERAEHEESTEDRSEALGRLLGHYRTTARDAANHLDGTITREPLTAAFDSRSHALDWLTIALPGLMNTFKFAIETGRYEFVIDAADSLHYFFELRKQPIDWVSTHRCAVTASQRSQNRRAEGVALQHLAIALECLGEIDEAIDSYATALAIHRAMGDRYQEAITLTNLGLARWSLGDIDGAIEYSMQALPVHQEVGNRREEGATQANLGVAYRAKRNFDKAIDCHQQDLAICQELHDRRGESVTLVNLGTIYRDLRQFNKAVANYTRDLKICEEFFDHHGKSVTLSNLGTIFRDLGKFDEALHYYLDAQEILAKTGDRHMAGIVMANLGTTYRDLHQPTKALNYYESALAIHREFRDNRSLAAILNYLGIMYRIKREFNMAINYAQQALEIARENADGHRQGEILRDLGKTWQEQGESDRAKACWRYALAALSPFVDTAARSDAYEIRTLLATIDE